MSKKQIKKAVPQAVSQGKQSMQAPAVAKQKFSLNVKLMFLLGAFAFLVYANTLKNGFAYDDNSVITENTIVTKGVSAIPEILSTPYRRGYFVTVNDLYRPLSLVTFAVEYQLFEKNAAPYHFMNILLFAGCVILLFWFLDTLFEQKKTAVAFIASLLFALHPIHTEVVANIKSRDELLCFFFAFLSLNVFMKYLHNGKMSYLLTGAVCYFLSFLAKETVVTFLAVIPLIFFFYTKAQNDSKKRSGYITVSAIAVAVIYLAIRFSVLNHYHADQAANVSFNDNALAKPDLSFASRIATAILILGYYLKLLFVPYPLISDYSYNTIPFATFSNPLVIISIIAYLALFAAAIKLFVKDRNDPYAFGILFFLITLSLFTNIPFLIGTTMGERLMFFPSVGFCLCIALIIEKWLAPAANTGIATLKSPKVLAVMIPLLLFYSVVTIARNNDWADSYTLYSTDVQKAPNSNKLNLNIGLELQKMGTTEKDVNKQKELLEKSIYYLNKSIGIYPDLSDAYAEIGNAFYRTGQYDSAEINEKRALALNPNNAKAINNLAGVYFIKHKYSEAAGLYKRAIELSPDFIDLYTNIGGCYGSLGKYDSAIYYFNQAILIDPDHGQSYASLAVTYKIMGKPDSVQKYEALAKEKK